MSDPDSSSHVEYGEPREATRHEVLAAARPLPSIEEMLIDGLTDAESQRLLDTIVASRATARQTPAPHE